MKKFDLRLLYRNARSPRGHRPLPRRHRKLTFSGEEGKLYRRIAYGVGAFLLLLLIINAFRVEPQLMNSAEISILRDRGVVRVGVRNDMPGFATDEGGLEAELATLLAARLLPEMNDDTRLELIPINSMNVGPKLSDGSIDVAVAMMRQNAYTSRYAYSTSYYKDGCYIVISPGTSLKLKNVSIGCVQSTPAASLLTTYMGENAASNLTSVTFASYPDLLIALNAGRVDCAALSELYIKKYEQEYGFFKTDIKIGDVDYAIACPADMPAIATVANMLLDDMRDDGSLNALYRRYGLFDQLLSDGEE